MIRFRYNKLTSWNLNTLILWAITARRSASVKSFLSLFWLLIRAKARAKKFRNRINNVWQLGKLWRICEYMMAEANGITEVLKAANQMTWVGRWKLSAKKSSISKSGGGAQCLAVIFFYLIFLSHLCFLGKLSWQKGNAVLYFIYQHRVIHEGGNIMV